MLEDFLCKMLKPQKAIHLLLIFLSDYIQDDIVTQIDATPIEKLNNILSIIYAINLISDDILRLRNEYYKYIEQELCSDNT